MKKRVFIVDDHIIVRKALTELINREEDLTVCGEAEQVPVALQAIAECEPDIAIIDLRLQHDSGIRLIENISYSYPELPMLVFSMNDESIYAERCLNLGARGYIMKKDPSEKIVPALRMILDGGIYISDVLTKNILHKFVKNKPNNVSSNVEILGNRELEVYQLLGEGLRKKEIAGKLNISPKTVDNNIRDIKKKMNLESLREVIVHAITFHNCV